MKILTDWAAGGVAQVERWAENLDTDLAITVLVTSVLLILLKRPLARLSTAALALLLNRNSPFGSCSMKMPPFGAAIKPLDALATLRLADRKPAQPRMVAPTQPGMPLGRAGHMISVA